MAETVTLETLGAMMRQILDEVRSIKVRQVEHTTWLSNLEQGQSLVLRMVTRVDEDLDGVRCVPALPPRAEPPVST